MPITIAITVVLLLSGLRVAQEYQCGVVFRLGRFTGVRGPGLFWIIPLGIERWVNIDIRNSTVSAEQRETITRDSVTIKVNAVLWYKIVDPAKSVIAVNNAAIAVYQLALTSLRNIIGQHDLYEVLQQVMAMQAEAIREKRARIIKAEAELEASLKLSLRGFAPPAETPKRCRKGRCRPFLAGPVGALHRRKRHGEDRSAAPARHPFRDICKQ